MAVAFRAATSFGWVQQTNTTINKPTGTAENDILVALIASENSTITAPSGWTKIHGFAHTQATPFYFAAYWKRAGASEGASYTWTHAVQWMTGAILAISGAATSGDPQDATYGSAASFQTTAVTIPSITTATNGSLVVALYSSYGTGTTSTPPSGWNERVDNGGAYAVTKTQTTAGATGATSATWSATDAALAIVIALKEGTSGLTINASAISSAASVHQPAVTPGSVTVAPNVIASAVIVRQPAVQPGSMEVVVAAIGSAAAMHQPTVTPGAVTVAMQAIASGAAVYQPTVSAGGSVIAAQAIGSAAVVHAVTVQPGSVGVAAVAIASAAIVRSPLVQPGAVTVAAEAIGSGATVHQPTVAAGMVIALQAVAATAAIYAPAVQPGAVTIALAAVAAGAVVHGPTVMLSAEQTVAPNVIAAGSLVYAVIVSVFSGGRIHRVGASGRSVTVTGSRTATIGASGRTHTVGD